MKILIGTPIHQCKDYAMERWLENVAQLQRQTPADLLLVDNSPGTSYAEKVKEYCVKWGVGNYEILHFDFNQGMSQVEKDRRIEKAQEMIRQHLLSHDYDAWFSWECDQIIPGHSLDQLIKLMKAGNFMMVVHNAWARNNPAEPNPDMGITLIGRECLKNQGFLSGPDAHWQGGEAWFKERVRSGGGSYIDVYGLIDPVYHLKEK